jgi:hypothetical protein
MRVEPEVAFGQMDAVFIENLHCKEGSDTTIGTAGVASRILCFPAIEMAGYSHCPPSRTPNSFVSAQAES